MSPNTRLALAGIAFIGCCNIVGCGLGYSIARVCAWWGNRTG